MLVLAYPTSNQRSGRGPPAAEYWIFAQLQRLRRMQAAIHSHGQPTMTASVAKQEAAPRANAASTKAQQYADPPPKALVPTHAHV